MILRCLEPTLPELELILREFIPDHYTRKLWRRRYLRYPVLSRP